MDEMFDDEYSSKSRAWIAILIAVLFVLGAFFSVRLYVSSHFGGVVVSGNSMETTLHHNEQLLMRKVAKGKKAERGDIIVIDVRGYAESTAEDGFIIKRLIATEGDRLYCKEGQVYIWYAGAYQYQELQEDYAYYERDKKGYNFASYENPYYVGKGEIFFLGDNRENSKDSRYKEGYSALTDRLYKEEDIYGVVEDWAITYQKPIQWLFFPKKIF